MLSMRQETRHCIIIFHWVMQGYLNIHVRFKFYLKKTRDFCMLKINVVVLLWTLQVKNTYFMLSKHVFDSIQTYNTMTTAATNMVIRSCI